MQGYLSLGVCVFGALQPTAKYQEKMKGCLNSEGDLLTGFCGIALRRNSSIFFDPTSGQSLGHADDVNVIKET